jgi:hypothetical protein
MSFASPPGANWNLRVRERDDISLSMPELSAFWFDHPVGFVPETLLGRPTMLARFQCLCQRAVRFPHALLPPKGLARDGRKSAANKVGCGESIRRGADALNFGASFAKHPLRQERTLGPLKAMK